MNGSRLAVLACVAAAALAALPAQAHGPYRPGWRAGVTIGVGPIWYRPWPGPWPYGGYGWYGPPAVVVAPPPQVVYIERTDTAAAPPAGFWYWCAEAQGWYPAVPACPSAWVAVPPQATR